MWRSAVLDEMPERPRDLLGLQAAAEHADDPGLALGQPRGPLESWHLLPGRGQDGGHRVAIEPSGARLSSELVRRLLRRQRLPVGTRRGHRPVGVGRGQHAGRHRQLCAGGSAVVAGAVEALVVRSGNRREHRQEL